MRFFDRVRRSLDSRDAYNEFLKLVNLFTQDIIDRARLVREARTYLGESELMVQFKDILGWDDSKDRVDAAEISWTRKGGVLDRPTVAALSVRYGSYRKLPASVGRPLYLSSVNLCLQPRRRRT
jgi:paired amphipathic helix protein Sin3a